MDMLEKAARAAAHAVHKFYNGESDERSVWAVCDRETKNSYRAEARAVLLAIREPDEGIKDKITIGGWIEDELKYDDVWQGTIDAILTTDATKETK